MLQKLPNGFQIYPVVAPALIVVGSMISATSAGFAGTTLLKRFQPS